MKIMVPLDGSNTAEEALAPALDLARRYEGELLLVTVLSSPPVAGDQATFQAESYLGYHKRALAEEVPCQALLLGGSAPENLIECAAENEVSLIAVTSHGRGRVGRWKLGRVTDKIMRSACCPVLIVRGRVGQFKRILVALDGTPGTETALVPAGQLARWGQLTLLRSAEFDAPYFGGSGSLAEAKLAQKQEEHRVAAYLAEVAKNREGTVICHPCAGSPAERIVECAEREADLIVLTSHSHNWETGKLFGSVAERVIHNGPCPVLLLRGERPLSFTIQMPMATHSTSS